MTFKHVKPTRTATGLMAVRAAAGPVAVGLVVMLVALFVGLFAAFMPAAYTARLGFMLVGVLVVVLALVFSPGVTAPARLTRRLLLLWIVVSVVWPTYLSYRGLPGPAVSPTRLVFWALLAVWFFWLIGSAEMRASLAARLAQARPFVLLLAFYLAWNIIAAVLSASPFVSLYAFVKIIGGPVLMLLIVLSCVRDGRDIDRLLFAMVIAAVVAVLIGLVEAVKQKNLFYELVPGLFPQGGEGELAWAEQLIRDKSRDGRYRVMSTFVHPLTFGEYLALCLSLTIYLAAYARQGAQRLIAFLAVPLLVLGIYITHTRSTQVALGIVALGLVGTLGLRAMRQQRSFAVSILGYFALAAVPLVTLALGAIALEFSTGRTAAEAGSTFARLTMLKFGGQALMEQPLVGYGPGFAAVTLGILPGFTALTIDNYYLSVALESGLPGLLVFIALMTYPVFKGLANSPRYPGVAGARIAVLAVALAGFIVVKVVLSQPDNMTVAFLVIALLLIALKPAGGTAGSQAPWPVAARGLHRVPFSRGSA